MNNCYVYLIQETYTKTIRGECAVKIGLAVDPLRRVRELQTGNARRLHLFMKIGPMSDKHAVQTEKSLHKRVKKWRLVGEWFEPCVIKMMQSPNVIGLQVDVEVFAPPINEDAAEEREAEIDLDRNFLAVCRRYG